MVAIEAGLEESLSWFLRGLNLENVSLRVQQKEAMRNIVVLRKDTLIILPTGFGKSLIFQLLPFVFDSSLGATKYFILVVSPLNALMRDQTVKLNDLQVSCLVVWNTESLSDVEINEIKQWKYRIIYGHPEAFVRKLRKLLDCGEVRCNMRAIVIDEAHPIVEWQVFNICLYLFLVKWTNLWPPLYYMYTNNLLIFQLVSVYGHNYKYNKCAWII